MNFGLEPLYDRIRFLEETIDQFLKDFNDLRLMDDIAVREPPSKHQRKLRQLCDLVMAFEYNIHKDEGTKDEF